MHEFNTLRCGFQGKRKAEFTCNIADSDRTSSLWARGRTSSLPTRRIRTAHLRKSSLWARGRTSSLPTRRIRTAHLPCGQEEERVHCQHGGFGQHIFLVGKRKNEFTANTADSDSTSSLWVKGRTSSPAITPTSRIQTVHLSGEVKGRFLQT